MKNRIKELLKEKKVSNRELARVIWPESSDRSRDTLMRNLMNGKGVNPPEWITKACEFLNVTPNELFGYEDK